MTHRTPSWRSTDRAALAISLLLGWCGSSRSETGVGDHFKSNKTPVVLYAPLGELGPDAIRVSVRPTPSFGTAWVVELHPKDAEWAEGSAASYHLRDLVAFQRVRLRRSEYETLVSRIDETLARGDPREFSGEKPGELIVCADPTSYVVERRKGGKTTWFDEDCSADMPAADAAELVFDAFPYPLCWYDSRSDADVCKRVRPPGVQHSEHQDFAVNRMKDDRDQQ